MPTNIIDVATWTATITTVADTEAANEANFKVMGQGLANRTAYLKAAQDLLVAYNYSNLAIRRMSIVKGAATGGYTQTLSTVSGYVDVTGASCVVTPAVGDILLAFATVPLELGSNPNANTAQFRFTKQSTSVVQSQMGAARNRMDLRSTATSEVGADSCILLGHHVAGFAEATTVKLQASMIYASPPDILISDEWTMFLMALKPQDT